MKLYLGMDPGWASFGLAKVNEEGKLVSAEGFIPRDFGLTEFVNSQFSGITKVESVVLERFVAYEGVHSNVNEPLLMLIGALQYRFENESVKVGLVRAIDWKPKLCKWLVRNKGFKNPASNFDKKFSLAAAQALSGVKFKSDHEADAVCLAYLGWIAMQPPSH